MHCPYCRHVDSRVVDSRASDDGTSIRRRRQCLREGCGKRFTTVETASLTVTKRSGAGEPFSRDKVLAGVRKACQGRPVSEDDLALLAHRVEETVRSSGVAEIEAHEVGMAVLAPLRELDEVAYLRFASVYRAFDDLEAFESEIAMLRAEREIASSAERAIELRAEREIASSGERAIELRAEREIASSTEPGEAPGAGRELSVTGRERASTYDEGT